MSEINALLGRCREKDCASALHATTDQVVEVGTWREAKQPGVAYRVGNYGVYARCPGGHKVFKLHRIKGVYSPDHKCDARCLNAKGHNCTCSCGGANHGTSWSAPAHAVEADREPQFVGEVGRTIKGTATIAGKRENVGQYNNTLLTFLTAAGDTIKWFAPHALGNIFEQGQELTFRAKVKAHEDNNFGKTTIVTYLEEVES